MNNKRGQVFLYMLMVGTLVIVLGLALSAPTKEVIDNARDSMYCDVYTNLSLSDETTCYALDISKPAFSGTLILLGIAILGTGVILR